MCDCEARLERLELFAERISDALEYVRRECTPDKGKWAQTFTGPNLSDPKNYYPDRPDWER